MENKEKHGDKRIFTFDEIADDISLLEFDLTKPDENGEHEICYIRDEGDAVSKWIIAPFEEGWQIVIEYDEGEDRASRFSMLPVSDMIDDDNGHGLRFRSFPSAEYAFEVFKDIVYATEESERFHEHVVPEIEKTLKGFPDPCSMSFEEFKDSISRTSISPIHNDDYHMTMFSNAMLSARYPFLVAGVTYGFEDDYEDSFLNWTFFDSIPSGWRYRFGLEMCEDIRNILWDEDPRAWERNLMSFRIDQIKEKFGELRLYYTLNNNLRERTDNKLFSLIECYSELSSNVCMTCGRADQTRVTKGWISPLCFDHLVVREYENVRSDSNSITETLHVCPRELSYKESNDLLYYIVMRNVFDNSTAPCSSRGMMYLSRKIDSVFSSRDRSDEHDIENGDGCPRFGNGERLHVHDVLLSVADDLENGESMISEREWKNELFFDYESTLENFGLPDID